VNSAARRAEDVSRTDHRAPYFEHPPARGNLSAIARFHGSYRRDGGVRSTRLPAWRQGVARHDRRSAAISRLSYVAPFADGAQLVTIMEELGLEGLQLRSPWPRRSENSERATGFFATVPEQH